MLPSNIYFVDPSPTYAKPSYAVTSVRLTEKFSAQKDILRYRRGYILLSLQKEEMEPVANKRQIEAFRIDISSWMSKRFSLNFNVPRVIKIKVQNLVYGHSIL